MSNWDNLLNSTINLERKYLEKKRLSFFSSPDRLEDIKYIVSIAAQIKQLESAGYGSHHMRDCFNDYFKHSVLGGAYLTVINKIKGTYQFMDYRRSELARLLIDSLGGEGEIIDMREAYLHNLLAFQRIHQEYADCFFKGSTRNSP